MKVNKTRKLHCGREVLVLKSILLFISTNLNVGLTHSNLKIVFNSLNGHFLLEESFSEELILLSDFFYLSCWSCVLWGSGGSSVFPEDFLL